MRHVRDVIVAALVAAGSTVVPAPGSAPVGAAAPPRGPDQPVIVLLRDQHDGVPATPAGAGRRRALTDADQRPLVDHAVKAGARAVKRFSIINGFAATMSPAERDWLASDRRVQAVVPDAVIRRQVRTKPAATAGGAPAAPAASSGICPSDPARPLLEPEALQLTHTAFDDPTVPQAQQLATGSGVKVAFVADGLDVRNPDLIRPDGSPVVVDFQDFTGAGFDAPSDGREAFGDASAIAAQGRQSYDLSSFVNPASPLPPGCTIRIRGMAPGASLVVLKVLDSVGGSFATIVQGIDYAVNVARVQVLNESLGDNPIPDRHNDPVSLANHAAVAAGVTVVAASGDAGPANTVGNPAGDPQVTSVGASTSFQVVAQTQRNIPGFTGGFTSDNVSAISSGGITEGATVDDLMAPGDQGWALCSTDTARFTGCRNGRGQPSPIQAFGGTSQAAPFTAGAAALVIEAFAAIQGDTPSPALVKRLLASTAADQGDPADRQGAGLLDALSAVRAAESAQNALGAPTAQADALLVTPSQLSATATPGTRQSLPLRVTNTGGRRQTVSARGRLLSRVVADQRGSVQLDATSPSTPTWRSGFGSVFAFVTRTITVPAGADHLDASIAFTPPGKQVVLRLLDPGGGFVARTDFEGPSGFGHLDVHAPVPGTWTAIFDSPASPTGFNGTVQFDFLSSANADFSTVVPSVMTLDQGQTGTFRVVVRTPDQPGDLSAAVQLDTSAGRRLAVPLTLRSLIPTVGGQGTFTGTLTGGNGRSGVGAPAQTTNYRFDVPAGLRDFGIGLTLGGDPHQALIGNLIAPDGQLLSQQSNVTAVDANGNPTAFSQSLQEFRRDPQPGRWTFVVEAFNPVAGTTTAQQFAGTLRFNTVDVAASGLPASRVTVLRAGVPVTARVTVHNNGVAPESFFVDPRSTARADLRLVPSFGEPETGLSLPAQGRVDYLVPTVADRVTTRARATAPIDLELESLSLEPDVVTRSGAGNAAATSIRSTEVGPGPYFATAALVGPFPAGGASATADLATFAHAQVFDGTVTSSTGDQWLATVQQSPPPFTPLLLQPSETGTITVTITPAGPAGTVVSGVLYVDDFNVFSGAGDELKAFPYTYTIG